MRLQDLEAANRASMDDLRRNPGAGTSDATLRPYFGYYEADIFECPPFIMFMGNDCPRGWNILFDRSFEPTSMRIWCRLARTATGILDVGAHVGTYSLAAAALREDLTIHAFEPNPYAFARLRMHKLVNGFWNIEEHTFAAGDKEAFVPFSWVKKPTLQIASGGGVGSRTRTDVETTVARMAPIDGLGLTETLGSRPLVKVDVEGGEWRTFRGMQNVMALKPDIILESFDQGACDAITGMTAPLGYSVYQILETEGRVEAREKLMPADLRSLNFNQLLTVRTPEEVAQLATAA